MKSGTDGGASSAPPTSAISAVLSNESCSNAIALVPESQRTQGTTMFGVHFGNGTHARGKRHAGVGNINRNPHRQALYDFYPVAGGILRRQQRETGAGTWAGTHHLAHESFAGIGIHREGRVLAGPHIGEVGFLEIGFDPD